jgi:hypothetical protein
MGPEPSDATTGSLSNDSPGTGLYNENSEERSDHSVALI